MAGPKQSSATASGRKPSASSAKARRRAQARDRSAPEPRTGRGAAVPVDPPPQPLGRADVWVAAGVAGAATIAFVTTFSSRAALGDAPESVAGVRSLGIIHAPGYATYVVAARVFGEIVRFGSWEFRVNLFSLVCSVLGVAAVYLLARCVGASKTGAAIGALALTVTTSFWFNAGFAKYYALSTLLVTVVALCVLLWQQTGRGALLVIAGVLVGSSLGVSWQLAAIMVVGLVPVVVMKRPRPGFRILLLTGAATLLTVIAVCVFIMVRAGQDPTVNYGHATSLSRLYELLTTADFKGTRETAGAGLANVAGGTAVNLGIIGRDIGIGAIGLAFVGAFALFLRRRLDHALFFAVVVLGNVVAISLVGGKAVIEGFFSGLSTGGQLTDAFVVVAVLAALGATWIVSELEGWQAETHRPLVHLARGRAALVAVMVLAAVVPSVVVHFENADHRIPALGDRYARRVLAALPPNSVFLAGGYEFGQPILARQVLYGDRPDVSVVFADLIAFSWYREELVHQIHLDPALMQTNSENTVTRVVTSLRKTRPVYADTDAMSLGAGLFGYQAAGLVGRVVAGTGPQAVPNVDTAVRADERELRDDAAQDGMTGLKYNRFPNAPVYFFYERAYVELAKQYALADNIDRAADELEQSLAFVDKSAAAAVGPLLASLRAHEPGAQQTILNF